MINSNYYYSILLRCSLMEHTHFLYTQKIKFASLIIIIFIRDGRVGIKHQYRFEVTKTLLTFHSIYDVCIICYYIIFIFYYYFISYFLIISKRKID